MKNRPITIRALGDWKHEIGVRLSTALAVVVENTGKTGAEACAKGMVNMAQSARVLTPTAKKNRPVLRNEHGLEYIEVYRQSGAVAKLFRFRYQGRSSDPKPAFTWEEARLIAHKGLAKRSWFWGLRGLPGAPAFEGKPMRGVVTLFTIKGNQTAGYELTDRIKFLSKILPAGWSQRVEQAVVNRIMAQARKKMEKDFAADMRRSARMQKRSAKEAQAVAVDVGRFFIKVAS